MDVPLNEDERAQALAELRAIRQRHGLSSRASRTKSARSEPSQAALMEPAGTEAEAVDAPDYLDNPDAVKYALELAAHRETTDRLLDEKDRTIEAQQALIAELRAQLGVRSE